MSELNQLSIVDWFDTLREEGLVGAERPLDSQAYSVHVDAFARSWADAYGIDEKVTARLKNTVKTLNRLADDYRDQDGSLFYGEALFEKALGALYGSQMSGFVAPILPQRRLVVHSEDPYQSRLFAKLLTTSLAESQALTIYEDCWSGAYEQKRLSIHGGALHTGQTAYQRDVNERVWVLQSPDELSPSQSEALVSDFPLRRHFALGTAELLITVTTTDAFAQLPEVFRQMVGLHGVLSVPTLTERLAEGIRVIDLLQSDARRHYQFQLSDAVARSLNALLEGRGIPDNRQSLLMLLMRLEARQCLEHATDAELHTHVTEVCSSSESLDAEAPAGPILRRFVAARLAEQQELPSLLHDVEKDAYLHAARVAQVRRPHQPVRMQDIADVLGIPRQTASRKWHAFGLEIFSHDD